MTEKQGCVGREEFELLKDEVKKIKQDMEQNSRILQSIDKKVDIINEKIVNGEEIDQLKLLAVEKRVGILEESQKWLRRTAMASAISIIAGAIVWVIKSM